jgi:hypothetical protein
VVGEAVPLVYHSQVFCVELFGLKFCSSQGGLTARLFVDASFSRAFGGKSLQPLLYAVS